MSKGKEYAIEKKLSGKKNEMKILFSFFKRMRVCIFLIFFFSLLVILSLPHFARASQISFQAREIEWTVTPPIVRGKGEAHLEYEDIELKAETVKFNLETLDLQAKGNIQFKVGTRTFKGQTLTYNLENQQGKMTPIKGKEDSILYRAEEVRLTPGKIRLSNAHFTTCKLSPPHYRINSKAIVIDLEDKAIIARNCFLYIGKYPIFWAPRIVRYFGEGAEDRNRIMFPQVGYSEFAGWYVRTGYHFYVSSQFQGTFHLDYREKKGWAEGVDSSYTLGEGKGDLRIYFIDEKDTQDKRWRLQLRHEHPLSSRTSLRLSMDRVSDENFLEDYFSEEDGKTPSSFLSLHHKRPGYNVDFLFQPEVNPFNYQESLQLLPKATINFYPSRIGQTQLYLGTGAELVRFKKGGEGLTRIDSFLDISRPFLLSSRFGLQVEPKAGYHFFWYKEGEKEGYRRIPYQELNTSMELSYGGAEWKHLLEPHLGYYHSTEDKDVFPVPFDLEKYEKETEEIHPSNALKFGIKDSISHKGKNVLFLDVSTRYNLAGEEKGFSSVEGKFRLTPLNSPHQVLGLYFLYDYFQAEYRRLEGTLHLEKKGWNLELGVEKDVEEDIHALTAQVALDLGEGWKISAMGKYDFLEKTFSRKKYSIRVPLHCWGFEFSYQSEPQKEYSILFFIRAFPE